MVFPRRSGSVALSRKLAQLGAAPYTLGIPRIEVPT
jgi:hypothetical protein